MSSMRMSGSAPPCDHHEVGQRRGSRLVRALRDEIAPQVVGLAHRRRQPTVVASGASVNSRARPRDRRSPRFEVTREWSSSSTTRRRSLKKLPRLAMRQQQGELLGSGQQDVRRALDLPGPLVRGRIARPGLDPDRQVHLADRCLEVARDVGRERLEGRNVEGVQGAALRPPLGPGCAARRQAPRGSAGSPPGLAGPGGRHQQDGAPRLRLGEELELMFAGRPVAGFEPIEELRGQDLRAVTDADAFGIGSR